MHLWFRRKAHDYLWQRTSSSSDQQGDGLGNIHITISLSPIKLRLWSGLQPDIARMLYFSSPFKGLRSRISSLTIFSRFEILEDNDCPDPLSNHFELLACPKLEKTKIVYYRFRNEWAYETLYGAYDLSPWTSSKGRHAFRPLR